ncbi:mitochondrial assembly of ribosomal large subunit protein 1-like isoform X2 [Electrophorus electricus]|uniref:mitochondrial assembly of ribosomal large subunit protein 1-like isoform X2 n=1 Tax=Electrophorus electricus TaxID=8005 RepID=UPI0015D06D33|nr:mitochondrial assembly of ribosomal large subunit protein 1-like isoform X2 [Electrophorus electricus]
MNTIHCSKCVFSNVLNQAFLRRRNAFHGGLHWKVTNMQSLGFPHKNAHRSNNLSLYKKLHFPEQNSWFCTNGSNTSVSDPYFTTSAYTRPKQQHKNAVDMCVIRVPKELKYAEHFIVVSGSSTRHLKAMALYAIKVYKFMKRDCDPNALIEGRDAEDWMCIDFGAIVVHFMLPETREVYELEKLWTLRSYDEQLRDIPPQMFPADFIFDAETK